MLDKNKVILGLSGGVDSASAALILKEKGLEVIGLFFDINKELMGETAKKAERVASELGIKFIYKNLYEEFNEKVVGNFVDEYLNGRTPNPCIVCNPLIKFKVLIDTADEEGAFYIATGHYANKTFNDQLNCHHIRMAKNIKKDQSYMLYRLSSSTIERLLLPLSDFDDKDQVRKLAEDNNMSNSKDKDSQEICFIEEGKNYIDFLREEGYKIKPGNFIDKDGNVLGKHKGVCNYTIGQRKGLGITFGKPVFVTALDAKANTVTLGDNEDLFTDTVSIVDCWFAATDSDKFPEELFGKEIKAKIRYAAKPAVGKVFVSEEGLVTIKFEEKQRAATPGQSVVVYLEDQVLGGGFVF